MSDWSTVPHLFQTGVGGCTTCGLGPGAAVHNEWLITNVPRETVNHPPHYGGADNPYEAIKVIEAWELDFCLGNTVKYICRAGRKIQTPKSELEDLKKARWYLDRRIEQLEAGARPSSDGEPNK